MNSFNGMGTAAAAAFFALSTVAFGATAANAIRVGQTPLPDLPSSPPPGLSEADPIELAGEMVPTDAAVPEQGLGYPHTSRDEILEAVNQDLFQLDRTPPLERYVLPSLRRSSPEPQRENRRRSEPDLRIVGTAIAGGVALAMVVPDDSLPFSVLQGEFVDGYLLASVEEETVTLVRGDSEFVLPVVEAGPARRSGEDRGGDRERAITEDMARTLSERIRQMQQQNARMQRMRGGTAPSGPDRPPFSAIELPVVIRTRPGGGGGGGVPDPADGTTGPDSIGEGGSR